MKTAALLLGGDPFHAQVEGDFILCADGGYRHAVERNIRPDVVMGDFDSFDIELVEKGVETKQFDPIKDDTDGEICLNYLIEKGFKKINIYGGWGTRIDHVAGNFNLLVQAYEKGVEAVMICDAFYAYYSEKPITLNVKKGDTVSLVPFTPQVHIMSTKGLYYPLHDANLSARRAGRGISNVALEEEITYAIDEGGAFLFRIL